MDWRLTADEGFYASVDELDDTDETAAIAEMLILRIASSPHRTEPIGDTIVRAVRGGGSGSRFPALRLFYTAEDGVVTLLRVERDEAAEAR